MEKSYADMAALEEIIHKMDVTPAPCLQFDVNEHMNIYNWLKELQMYRKIGPLRDIVRKERKYEMDNNK